jgi:hypothetical protein
MKNDKMRDFYGHWETSQFSNELAVKYGINPAIIVNGILKMQRLNAQRNRNEANGVHWVVATYLQLSTEVFPFFTHHQVRYYMGILRDKNLIKVANFNTDPGNRTLWFRVEFPVGHLK